MYKIIRDFRMDVIDYALETIDHIDNPKDIMSKFLRHFPTNDFLLDTAVYSFWTFLIQD